MLANDKSEIVRHCFSQKLSLEEVMKKIKIKK